VDARLLLEARDPDRARSDAWGALAGMEAQLATLLADTPRN
jgi:hypothetical protein